MTYQSVARAAAAALAPTFGQELVFAVEDRLARRRAYGVDTAIALASLLIAAAQFVHTLLQDARTTPPAAQVLERRTHLHLEQDFAGLDRITRGERDRIVAEVVARALTYNRQGRLMDRPPGSGLDLEG